jgi:hypothetical protein
VYLFPSSFLSFEAQLHHDWGEAYWNWRLLLSFCLHGAVDMTSFCSMHVTTRIINDVFLRYSSNALICVLCFQGFSTNMYGSVPVREIISQSDNKVRELIAVKVLHTLLLNITVIVFKVLPLGRCAPMPAPSPPFRTILELILWNDLQNWCRINSDVINVIKCIPFNTSFIFGNRKQSLGAWSGE